MAYTRVNWQNSPSHATPLSAENLNVMDAAIEELDGAVTDAEGTISTLESTVSDQATTISGLQTTVGEHTADIGNMEDDISGLQTTVSGHTTSIGNLQTTVSGHTTSIGTLANLATTEKSNLVGAINEVNEDVSDVKEDLKLKADLPTETIENTSIASFTDGAEDVPVKELKVGIEPIQNLHGYDNPWPAGGGKNKWSLGSPYTVEGSTTVPFDLPAGTYTFSALLTATDTTQNHPILFYENAGATGEVVGQLIVGNGTGRIDATVTLSGDAKSMSLFAGNSWGQSQGESITYTDAQLEVGSSATTFAPYSNICPISGRDSVTLTRTGVNVWDEEWEVGGIDHSTGQNNSIGTVGRSKNYIPCVPSTTYCFAIGVQYACYMHFYDVNKNYINYQEPNPNAVFTTPSNAYYMRFNCGAGYGTTYNHDISINYPSTDHYYHSGADNASYPIPLSSTIYGGTLDVGTGVLTVDRAMVDLGTVSWNWQGTWEAWYTTLPLAKRPISTAPMNGISEKYVTQAFTTMVSDHSQTNKFGKADTSDTFVVRTDSSSTEPSGKLVYELATPTTIQLTPTQVTTLLKDNNIFADSGDIVKLIYRADLGAYIEKLINA